jgi:hypothetical protein
MTIMTLKFKILGFLLLIADGAFWIWLFLRACRGHYPVTFIGWVSLIVDPLIFVMVLYAVASGRKSRGRNV